MKTQKPSTAEPLDYTDWLGRASKVEVSLLLFLETCAVDKGGKIVTTHMNAEDMEIAKRWNEEGFVSFGRIASEDISQYGSHWCNLSETAWKSVGAARRARAMRQWGARKYTTTEEKRERPNVKSSDER